jgi:hypothetical protein
MSIASAVYIGTSRRAAVSSDAVPNRAPMQVSADPVKKLHSRELRIVEADKAALAPERQHAGKVCNGAVESDPAESPCQFGEADALGDDQPVKPDCIRGLGI